MAKNPLSQGGVPESPFGPNMMGGGGAPAMFPPAMQQGGGSSGNSGDSVQTPPAMPDWKPGDTPYNPMSDPQNVLGVGVKGGLDPTGSIYGKFTPQQQQIASAQVRSLYAQGYSPDYVRNWFNNYSQNPDAYAQQQQGIGSVYSSQNLNEYTKNFMIPFMDHVQNMVQGDLKNWGSAINQIMAGGGMGGTQVAKDLSPNSTEVALYQTLAPLIAMSAQGPGANYYNMVNAAIGADQTAGGRIEAQNAMYQNLLASGALGNTGQAGTSALGNATTSGIQGVMANVGATQTPSIQTITNALNPNSGQVTGGIANG